MNTNITLTAEQIAQACKLTGEGDRNRQEIEESFERQTPPEVFTAALARADAWPTCRNEPAHRYGLQYAYMLEFLICDEVKRAQMGGGE